MLICYEEKLMNFFSNQSASQQQIYNNGIRTFKGMVRHLEGFGPEFKSPALLLSINQYDMSVETLLYYDPMAMIHGNRNLDGSKVLGGVLLQMLKTVGVAGLKRFDDVTIWKISVQEMKTGKSHTALLSLGDLVSHYESEMPDIIDLKD